jgi:hypothetical protein
LIHRRNFLTYSLLGPAMAPLGGLAKAATPDFGLA